jgi:nitrate/nitrite transporter NarK
MIVRGMGNIGVTIVKMEIFIVMNVMVMQDMGVIIVMMGGLNVTIVMMVVLIAIIVMVSGSIVFVMNIGEIRDLITIVRMQE